VGFVIHKIMIILTTPQKLLHRTLIAELAREEKRGKPCSLRGLSRTTGISHSLLSQLISGKRPITTKSWTKLTATFPQLAVAGATYSDSAYYQLNTTDFARISDWHHYAILSLIETESFRMNFQWIAKRLNISATQARIAVSSLIEMKILAHRGGRWQQITGPLKIENKKPLAPCLHQQRQLLEKAIASLEKDSFEIRDFSSMTLAINPADIPYARQRIRDFRRELTQELEQRSSQKEVYHLTVQIYPVSKPIEERVTSC
jgi:hypothetical protein